MEAPAESHGQLGTHPRHSVEGASVLLVDDDRQLAEELQRGLAGEGFVVDLAHDGSVALQKINIRQFDAVVCDVMIPRLRGDELYRYAVECRPSIRNRFLFITGFAANTSFNEFLGRNHCKFLFKPFDLQSLIDGVRQLTQHS
jgi:DNA-binding response OmpR family regulator